MSKSQTKKSEESNTELNNETILLDQQLTDLFEQEILPENEVDQICQLAEDIFLKEGNILYLNSPIVVCGDTHGQFNDLQTIFTKISNYRTTKFLFLGDYVDRGEYSIETITLLVALKGKRLFQNEMIWVINSQQKVNNAF